MHQFKAAILLYQSSLEGKNFMKLKETQFLLYLVIKLTKPLALATACMKLKNQERYRYSIVFVLMLSRIFREALMYISNITTTKLSQKAIHH